MDCILDDIRETVNIDGDHLINRQDLHNININCVRKHNESVSAWVEEMRAMEYDPVVLFKQQGKEQRMTWTMQPSVTLY